MGMKLVDDLPTDAQFAAAMKRATKNTAPKALKRAKDKAPVKTGKLRDSGEINDAHRPAAGTAETSVDFTADYASFVHDGHFNTLSGRFVAGQPFLANALNESEDDLGDEAEKELKALGAKRVRRF